jgi:hypothetical protein
VDEIFKGTKPADLPVSSRRTGAGDQSDDDNSARADVPQSLLINADKVIK